MLESARRYSAPISISSAFTAAIDVFELLAASGKPLVLISFEIGQPTEIGDTQEEQLLLIMKRASGSFTSGSGGGTSTARPLTPNDTAAGATIETGNTTQVAVGSGALVTLAEFQWNLRSTLLHLPVPEERVTLAAGEALTLGLSGSPADSIGGIHGRLVFAELV